MFDLGTIGAVVKLDDSPYTQTMAGMTKRSEQQLNRIKRLFASALGAYGAYRILKNASSAAMEFSFEVANIASIADNLDMSKIRNEILEIDSVLGDSAKLANSMYFAYSAGIRGTEKELSDFTATMARMSVSINADQTQGMDAATSLMNAYRLSVKDAGKVTDWFFSVVEEGKTTGAKLSGSLGMIVNSAATAKIPLAELGGAIAVLTRTMPTEQAITSLNQVIAGFISPTKEAKETAAKYNIELSATALQSKGLAAALQEVKDKAGGNVEALSQMFGSIRSFRAAAALAGDQADAFHETVERFKTNDGAMLDGFAEKTDNLKTKWETAMVDMNKAAIDLGENLGPLILLTASVTSGLSSASQLSGLQASIAVLGISILLRKRMAAQAIKAEMLQEAATQKAEKLKSLATAKSTALRNMLEKKRHLMVMQNATREAAAVMKSEKIKAMASMGAGKNAALIASEKKYASAKKGVIAANKAYIASSSAANTARANEITQTGILNAAMVKAKRGLKGFHSSMKGTSKLGTSMNYLGGAAASVGVAIAGWQIGEQLGKAMKLSETFDEMYSRMHNITGGVSEKQTRADKRQYYRDNIEGTKHDKWDGNSYDYALHMEKREAKAKEAKEIVAAEKKKKIAIEETTKAENKFKEKKWQFDYGQLTTASEKMDMLNEKIAEANRLKEDAWWNKNKKEEFEQMEKLLELEEERISIIDEARKHHKMFKREQESFNKIGSDFAKDKKSKAIDKSIAKALKDGNKTEALEIAQIQIEAAKERARASAVEYGKAYKTAMKDGTMSSDERDLLNKIKEKSREARRSEGKYGDKLNDMQSQKSVNQTVGSFNAAVLALIGGGSNSPQERTAKASEKQVKVLKKVEKNTKDNKQLTY